MSPILYALRTNTGKENALEKTYELQESIDELILDASWAITTVKSSVAGLEFVYGILGVKAVLTSPTTGIPVHIEKDYSWYVQMLQETLDGIPIDMSNDCKICEENIYKLLGSTSQKPPSNLCGETANKDRCKEIENNLNNDVGNMLKKILETKAVLSAPLNAIFVGS